MGARVAPHWLSILGSVVALGVVPGSSFSQESLPDKEQRIFEAIEAAQAAEGARSPALIQLLAELGTLYEAEGEHALATTALEEARQVVRVNYGLHSIEQLPLIQQALANQRALGDFAMVQALEEELLELAARNPSDLRTVAIHRDAGERRLDLLRRFLAGEAPTEIYPDVWLSGFYKEDLVDELLTDAQVHFADAAAVILRNRLYSSDELRDLETEIIRANDVVRQRRQRLGTDSRPENGMVYDPDLVERRNTLADLVSRADSPDLPAELQDALRPAATPVRDDINASRYELDMTGAHPFGMTGVPLGLAGVHRLGAASRYQFGKDSYSLLIAYDELAFGSTADEAALRGRLETYLQLADWELLYSQNGRALDQYARVHELLTTNDLAEPLIAELFAPPIPTVLPTFLPNLLETQPSARYIEVSFEVTKYGESRSVEIVGAAPNVSRAAKDELASLIKGSRFRPRVVDGKLGRAAPVVVRYYLND